MLYTRCKTTCSKPRSFLGGGRRKCTPSKPRQGRMEIPLMRPWRLLLQHVIVKKKRGFFTSKKSQETAEAETIFNGTIKDTLAKTEALEKHVKTVNIRVESLATTEADFFKALPDRQEEAQKHLNELSAQVSQRNTASRFTQRTPHSAGRRNKHTAGAQSLLFFLTPGQSPKSGGLMFARRQWERNDLALLMSSAAHLMH